VLGGVTAVGGVGTGDLAEGARKVQETSMATRQNAHGRNNFSKRVLIEEKACGVTLRLVDKSIFRKAARRNWSALPDADKHWNVLKECSGPQNIGSGIKKRLLAIGFFICPVKSRDYYGNVTIFSQREYTSNRFPCQETHPFFIKTTAPCSWAFASCLS
jgi:hypothetical protein